MIKLANPLYYPMAVLAGGVVLAIGVRFMGISNVIILPTAAIVATAGASLLKSREPDPQKLAKQQLQRELQLLQASGKTLAEKAEVLRFEANQLLSSGDFQLEMLSAVQYACGALRRLPHRAIEVPTKINQLASRLQGADSLLSVSELQQQLLEVQTKQQSSSGVASQHLSQLADSLNRNIQLAREGQDTRTAQIISLYRLIQDTAGALQQLQNKLRTSNLIDLEQVNELRSQVDELNSFQSNLDLLIKT